MKVKKGTKAGRKGLQKKKNQKLTDTQARWIFSLIFLAHRSLIKDGDEYLSKLNLGRAQFRVMFVLKRKAGYTMSQIREVLDISNQAITRVLKQLLVEGYVRQELSIEDRRMRFLFLTEKGESVIENVTRLQRKCLDKAMEEVGPEKIRGLNDAMLAMLSDVDRQWMSTAWEDDSPIWSDEM